MNDNHNLDIRMIPADAPDSDPAWAGFLRQEGFGFYNDDFSDEKLARFIEWSRADETRHRMVFDSNDLLTDTPLGTLSSSDRQLNVGAGRQIPANLITGVTVRATHRRQGIMRSLLELDLTEAKKRGTAVALLTASEGSIYGRFGFGVGCRFLEAEINCAKFELREEPTGTVSYLRPDQRAEVVKQLSQLHSVNDRGAIEWLAFHQALVSGEVDWDTGKPSTKLRFVVHLDTTGQIDGMASYRSAYGNESNRIIVDKVLAVQPNAELALWQFLVNLDLVETLEYKSFAADPILQAALVNPRALKPTRISDMLWVRVLDIAKALGERGWDHDGTLVLQVTDSLEFIAGVWRIDVAYGKAHVIATDEAPEAVCDAETVGSLLLGGIAPAAIAAAGRITGDAKKVARFFTVVEQPVSLVGF
ncbi:MAG: GNAT family N-acetyltransferase [Propionibacteriaceae bacterium]